MSLLGELGYWRVRAYPGGMKEWAESGGAIERAGRAPPSAPGSLRSQRRLYNPGGAVVRVIDAIASRSVGQIMSFWLAMVIFFGFVYWLGAAAAWPTLLQGGAPAGGGFDGLGTSMYFSFSTATSVGYGDVTPVGFARCVAMIEAILALLIFGFIVSKFLGKRQEELVEEIHRISFEERLDRVQSNLHFVLAELQLLADTCKEPSNASPRLLARIDSTAMVFAGELRTIHDLLYRPQETPEETVLEGILANLRSAFEELMEVVRCLGERRSLALDRNLMSISQLASEICGECVPRQYAPGLKELMDSVQALAKGWLTGDGFTIHR